MLRLDDGDYIKIARFFEDEWFRVELGMFGSNVGFYNHKACCYGEIDVADVTAIKFKHAAA